MTLLQTITSILKSWVKTKPCKAWLSIKATCIQKIYVDSPGFSKKEGGEDCLFLYFFFSKVAAKHCSSNWPQILKFRVITLNSFQKISVVFKCPWITLETCRNYKIPHYTIIFRVPFITKEKMNWYPCPLQKRSIHAWIFIS